LRLERVYPLVSTRYTVRTASRFISSGQALRIRADVLRRTFDQSPAVRHVILDYWHSLLGEIARVSACHCFPTAQQRLSWWLLIASDRAQLQTIHKTHEDLSNVLAFHAPQ
jgi:hypothetical protein